MCAHVIDGAGGGKSCCGVLADGVITEVSYHTDILTDMHGTFRHM